MRYRLATIADVPALGRLYVQFLHSAPALYPQHSGDDGEDVQEFATNIVTHLAGNPNFFCVVGVVGSRLDGDRVLGGTAKAMISVAMGPRFLGKPKTVAFCELLVVDEHCRGKGHARKMVMIACRHAFAKGAEVLECAWRYGSAVGDLWQKIGMVPYHVSAAFVDAEGNPRTDLILLAGTREPVNNRAAQQMNGAAVAEA